jgi:hypothetical protein
MSTKQLLEQVTDIQKELDEVFGLFKKNKPQPGSNEPSMDLLEEVRSIIDLLLNETRLYMGKDIDRNQYDKMNLFTSRIEDLKNLLTTYQAKNSSRLLIKNISDIIIAPLTHIQDDTPVVHIEKQLINMMKYLNSAMGVDKTSVADFDDMEAEPTKSPEQIAQDAMDQRDQIKDLTEAWKLLERNLK